MERIGDVVYMAGGFRGIARRAPRIAVLDPQSGALATNLTELDPATSAARAVVASADGSAYVAGTFSGAGGVIQPRLLRYDPDGTLDRNFRPQIAGGDIDDIAVGPDGTVYAAGSFTSAGGQPRLGLAAFNPATGAVTGWRPQATTAGGSPAPVAEIEIGSAGAYVAGDFGAIAGAQRPGLAQVSLTGASAATAWNPQPSGGAVSSIVISGSVAYLAGGFSTVGGTMRRGLAAVGATGAGAVSAWNPNPDGPVGTIAVQGSTVYVAGRFSTIGSPPSARRSIAALDAGTGQALAWTLALENVGDVNAILPTADRLYLGFVNDLFTPAVGGAPRCGVAAVDPATAVVQPFDPKLTSAVYNPMFACGGAVTDLALAGGRLWALGSFDAAGIQPRSGLAALDVRLDQPLPWAPEPDRPNQLGDSGVRDLLASPDGQTIYLAGRFANLNGVARLNAAAVAATGVASAGTDVRPWEPIPNGAVGALARSPSGVRIYLGGEFTAVGNPAVPRARLAWVNATNGAPSPWNPSADARVSDFAVQPDGEVFVSGAFTRVGAGAPADRRGIALLSATTGDPAPWNAGLEIAPGTTSAQVDSISLAGELLYASGRFAAPGAQAVSVAAFERATGTATPVALTAQGGGQRVEQVSPAPDGSVFLLGSFTSLGGVARTNAAQAGADGRLTGWDPPGVRPGAGNLGTPDVQYVGDRVVVGGGFETAGSRPQAGFAVFGPATAPGPGTPPTVGPASPVVGGTLTCTRGSFTGSRPFTPGYEWLRDGQPIPGQAGATYVATPDDVDRELRCRETATNAAGSSQQTSAPVRVVPLPPALEVLPAVGGEPWVGGVATCSTGLWRNGPDPNRFSFRWLLDGAPVAGATTRSLAVPASYLGRALACEVTAANSAGSATGQSAALTVGVAPPLNLSSPLLSGEARVGAEVACDPGAWNGATGYGFSWLRDGVVIPGASGNRLRLTSRDLGLTVACRVSASGPGGVRSADSAAARVQALPRQPGGRTVLRGGSGGRRGVDVRRARVSPDGSLLLKIAVPGAGILTARATATLSKASAAARVLFGRTSAKPRAAGTVSLRLKPGRRARGALRRAGRRGVQVRLVVRFRPTAGGAQRSDRVTLRVRSRPSAAFTASSLVSHDSLGSPT